MGKEHKEHTWNLIAKKLAAEASPAELQELEALLRNNPELHYPVQTIADLWDHTSPADKKQAEEAFGRHLDRIDRLNINYTPTLTVVTDEPERPVGFWRKALVLGPLALILIGAILLITRPVAGPSARTLAQPSVPDTREITTTTGSRTSITLPDSTRVWLNAGSHIQYGKGFGGGYREVNLTGEAFF